jgi:hypothetical protein
VGTALLPTMGQADSTRGRRRSAKRYGHGASLRGIGDATAASGVPHRSSSVLPASLPATHPRCQGEPLGTGASHDGLIGPVLDLGVSTLERAGLPRKEVIQPQLPLRLPCYDFVPITRPTLDGCLPEGLAHRLQVLPAFVT